MIARSSANHPHRATSSVQLDPGHERLAELERRSLLAEQARRQAHSLRSPLSVIELVTETLQLELADDSGRVERIQRVLDAVSTLSTSLTQTLRSNRFADGPKRPVDAAKIATEVVLSFGGRIDNKVRDAGFEARHGHQGSAVLVDEQGFEAALVHLLRLIGIGNACNGVCGQRPLLRVEHVGNVQRLRLCFTSEEAAAAPVPTERADYRLMLDALERLVRDSNGVLVLGQDRARLELPMVSR